MQAHSVRSLRVCTYQLAAAQEAKFKLVRGIHMEEAEGNSQGSTDIVEFGIAACCGYITP
jgi:hypothetical protein